MYGLDGELVAEYRQGYAPFVPTKEYGYRNGQLLVTASNGDEQRLTNYVAQLYYRAGGYSSANVQTQVNTLANAGAQGETQLRTAAQTVVRQIYQASTLPAGDLVAALYLGVLQRYGDPGGLAYWTSIAQSDRNAVIEAFVGSGEFNERAQVLYGREVNEYDRTDKFTHYLYNVIEGRGATATERDARRAAVDGANVLGQSSVVTNAKDFARSLFNGAEYAGRNRSNSEFVSDLYFAFLRYAPDAGGWNYWTGEVGNQGRTAIMEAFLNAGAFEVQAGALYREVLWLVPDHLGTPRMIAERTGSAAGIKHHDYLPFGEELFSGIAGRDASHGYGAADSARQQFTAYERDDETGLDYAQARYYSSAMGRFVSVDPLLSSAKIYIPQSWNRYSYAYNNPLKYTDPLGAYVWDASLGGSTTDDELNKTEQGRKIVERRNAIRTSIGGAKAAAFFGVLTGILTESQANEIARAVDSYGKEGTDNGVTVAYGKVSDGAQAETSWAKDSKGRVQAFDTDQNGNVTAKVRVTFSGTIDIGDVAHEGSHVADRQALGKAVEVLLKGNNLNASVDNLLENVTRYVTERRAYQVSSSINQIFNRPSQVWNSGWSEADRGTAINTILRNNKLYQVTEQNQGPRIYSERAQQ